MELQTKTPKEVAQTIQEDLHSRPLTIAEAARILGKTPQSLYNILRGEFRISLKMSKALHDTFGYSRAFLQQGIGELIDKPKAESEEKTTEGQIESSFGVYYADDSLFTEREKTLNMISRVLSETFSHLNRRLPLGIHYDLSDPDENSLSGFETRSEIERKLVGTIELYSGMIRQLTDTRNILNSHKLKEL